MTSAEMKALLKAKDETIAAKNQVIIILSDMVDDLRARVAPSTAVADHGHPGLWPDTGGESAPAVLDIGTDWRAAAEEVLGASPQITVQPPRLVAQDRSMWVTDDEEDLMAAVEAGEIDMEEFERKLAAIQASNTEIQAVQ